MAEFNEVMLQLQEMTNKQVKQYKCLFSESGNKQRAPNKINPANKKRRERKRIKHTKLLNAHLEANKEHIKNITTEQINLLGRGLKFIPTPVKKETQIWRQLSRDFDQFARRMRLQYIFQGEDNKPHPFHVKSTWVPPIQPSYCSRKLFRRKRLKFNLQNLRLQSPKITCHQLNIN